MRLKSVVLLAFLLAFAAASLASEVSNGYKMPPQEVIDIVDAPVMPDVEPAPGGDTLLLLERPPVPTLSDLAQPEERLAGIRINPRTNGPSRPSYYTGLQLKSIHGDGARDIRGLPRDARIRDVNWSPDGAYIAFTQVDEDGTSLWLIDVERARASQFRRVDVNAAYPGTPYAWAPDSRSLWVRSVPSGRGDPPTRSRVPSGPVIQESRGRLAPARTYQDLLENEHDERLFDHYFTSQLLSVNLRGRVSEVGEPGIIAGFSPAPDGDHLLVTRLQRPYSYTVPFFRFARTVDVWDRQGRKQYRVVDRPLAADLPIAFDAVVTGPRNIEWRADAPATLLWAQAQDGGDPRREVESREYLFTLSAPFDGEPREFMRLGDRHRGWVFGNDDTALAVERWWDERRERVWRFSPADPSAEPEMVWERSFEDRYADPGQPLMQGSGTGHRVLVIKDGAIFLAGRGASPEGNRPFVDRFELASGRTERLWRSESPWYEEAVAMLETDGPVVLTRREASDQPPNFRWRHLASGESGAITDFPHPMPGLRDTHREVITYEREDGVSMSATLLLPPGYEAERDGPLPTVVWAYPREFRSADAAGQLDDSPYRFNRISYWRPQFLVTQGYAVLDNATMPVIGEGNKEPNDSFIEQLVANSKAAIQAGVERGVTDRDRVALGGHSYGAFMTANVLAHSELFRAGIARSGAYNRSMTPFGFQREQRTIWDDTELYIRMSPFFHAHTLTTPLLLLHGAEDNNSGTFPMQSERLFNAMQGLGGTVRLVMLPEESHGYRARESILHMLWETIEWLDEFVKHTD
jgi:dipeptidyl aminopeptidase/acylaminoacyl peptidase